MCTSVSTFQEAGKTDIMEAAASAAAGVEAITDAASSATASSHGVLVRLIGGRRLLPEN